MRSARPGSASAFDGTVFGFPNMRSSDGPPEGGRVIRSPAKAGHYVRGFGAKIANIAPCGSLNTAKRPASGMSLGGTVSLPPSVFAFAALCSTLATWKYGIQYDGTCAGTCGGIGIMPMLGWPLMLNS